MALKLNRLPPQDATDLVEILLNYPLVNWGALIENILEQVKHAQMKILQLHPIYYPPPCDVFRAMYLTPLSKVKVVIVGQSPYHSKHKDIIQAHGLSFSVRRGVPIPPSLINVYNELEQSMPGWVRPKHGDLTRWAQAEGVLLLNQCLTVIPGNDVGHNDLWKGVVKVIVETVVQKRPHTVFMLWGGKAKQLEKFIGGSKILKAGHPSPENRNHDFIGCNHFNLANEYLVSHGIEPVDWRID